MLIKYQNKNKVIWISDEDEENKFLLIAKDRIWESSKYLRTFISDGRINIIKYLIS